MLSYIISVEDDNRCLAACSFAGSPAYLKALFAICRYIDEHSLHCIIRLMNPYAIDNVLEGREIHRLAKAAQIAGINYK